jgi:hypothetical protein
MEKRRSPEGSRRSPPRVRTSTTFASSSAVGPDGLDVVPGGDQSLAGQEAGRELLVLPRRAHGHCERLSVHPDLERLLDGDLVVNPLRAPGSRHPLDPGARDVGLDRYRHGSERGDDLAHRSLAGLHRAVHVAGPPGRRSGSDTGAA